jgi:hypothetical protein
MLILHTIKYWNVKILGILKDNATFCATFLEYDPAYSAVYGIVYLAAVLSEGS